MNPIGLRDDILRRGFGAAHLIRRVYWLLRRPTVVGVRVLVRTEDGRMVLVEHTYERGVLYLPGGRLDREGCAEGALRELYEETGIRSMRGVGGLRLLTVLSHFTHGKTDHIVVYDLPSEDWTGEPTAGRGCRSEILRVTLAPINDVPRGASACTVDSVRAFCGSADGVEWRDVNRFRA